MSQFLGTLDARMPQYQTSLLDLAWFLRAGRIGDSHRVRNECAWGARMKFVTAWPPSLMMSGDRSSGYCAIGQDAADFGWWSPTQRASRGNGALKFMLGRCKDGSGNGVSGATVQGFLTETDQFVRETTADSNGNYELGTEYPAQNHYLVAYRAGSPDIAGTTVNTLQPTNRDGT